MNSNLDALINIFNRNENSGRIMNKWTKAKCVVETKERTISGDWELGRRMEKSKGE